MAEKKRVPMEKNPVGAAVLSAITPGVGFFYLGNVVKGIAYILIFASLIVLEVESRGMEHLVFALMIAGFYFFQIFDSYNEAKKANLKEIPFSNGDEKITMFASVLILVIGIFFQLATLDIIRYRDITKFWPLILIIVGAKFLYNYSLSTKENNQENKYPLEQNQNGGQNE